VYFGGKFVTKGVGAAYFILVYTNVTSQFNSYLYYVLQFTFKHAYPMDILQLFRLSSASMIHLPSGVVPPIQVASYPWESNVHNAIFSWKRYYHKKLYYHFYNIVVKFMWPIVVFRFTVLCMDVKETQNRLKKANQWNITV